MTHKDPQPGLGPNLDEVDPLTYLKGEELFDHISTLGSAVVTHDYERDGRLELESGSGPVVDLHNRLGHYAIMFNWQIQQLPDDKGLTATLTPRLQHHA